MKFYILFLLFACCQSAFAKRQITFPPPVLIPSPPPPSPPPSPGTPPAPPLISIQSPGFVFSLIFPGYTASTFTTALQQQLCDDLVSVNAPAGSFEICTLSSLSTWNGTSVLVNGYFFYGWSVDPTTSQVQLAQALRDQSVQKLRNNASALFNSPLNKGYPNCACKGPVDVINASSTTPFDYTTNLTGIPGPVQCGARLIYNTAIGNAQAGIVGVDDGSGTAANLGKYCSNPAVAGGVLGTPGAGSCRQYGVIASAAGTTQATAKIQAPSTGQVLTSMVYDIVGGSGYSTVPAVTISAPNPVNAVVSVILTGASNPQATVDTANGPYQVKPDGVISNSALCIDTAMDASIGCSGSIATVNNKMGFTCTNSDLNSATACGGSPCIVWQTGAANPTENQKVQSVTYPGSTTANTFCATTPTITISDTFLQSEVQAKATATVSGGAVTSITVNPPGNGYRTTPTITIAAPTASDLGKLCSSNPVTLPTSIAVNSPIAGGITTTGQCQPLGLDTQMLRVCSVPAAPNGGIWETLNVGTCNVVSSFRNQPSPTDTNECGVLAQIFITTPAPGPSPPPASPPAASPPQAPPPQASPPVMPSPPIAPSPPPPSPPLVCIYKGDYYIKPLYSPCNNRYLASGTDYDCTYNLVTLRTKSQVYPKYDRIKWTLNTEATGSLGTPNNIIAKARPGCTNKNLAAPSDPTTLKVGGTSWKWQVVPWPKSTRCDEVNLISQNRLDTTAFLEVPRTCDRFRYNATDGGRQRFKVIKV